MPAEPLGPEGPGVCYRPLPRSGRLRPEGALPLAGGPLWFTEAVRHEAGRAPVLVPAAEIPAAELARITAPRAPVCGLSLEHPRIMAILNVTPDSFSDGGRYLDPSRAVAAAEALAAEGADILDIGGESTRPGAAVVPEAEECARVLPVIAALRRAGCSLPISIDTRKPNVARAAVGEGADLWNDVSGLGYVPEGRGVAADLGVPVCLMHAQGDPQTMQDAPTYGDVVLEVHVWLSARVAAAEAAGLSRERILVDPGIGFGKTVAHNLALVEGLAILHGTGCPILFGASRKRFIGTIGGSSDPEGRLPGSLAVALEALRQGAQVIRVHDVEATRQAIALWRAMTAVE